MQWRQLLQPNIGGRLQVLVGGQGHRLAALQRLYSGQRYNPGSNIITIIRWGPRRAIKAESYNLYEMHRGSFSLKKIHACPLPLSTLPIRARCPPPPHSFILARPVGEGSGLGLGLALLDGADTRGLLTAMLQVCGIGFCPGVHGE